MDANGTDFSSLRRRLPSLAFRWGAFLFYRVGTLKKTKKMFSFWLPLRTERRQSEWVSGGRRACVASFIFGPQTSYFLAWKPV